MRRNLANFARGLRGGRKIPPEGRTTFTPRFKSVLSQKRTGKAQACAVR
nr:MAG TPA: hypothetical protein [Caudoviricetes sp.]